MQRYGDLGLIPNKIRFSYPTCCDSKSDLRQSERNGAKSVAVCGSVTAGIRI